MQNSENKHSLKFDIDPVPPYINSALYSTRSIRNGHIRHDAEISGNFKKQTSKGSNLRNALK